MDPVDALRELGGVARRRVMLRRTSRKRLQRAVLRGEITRTSRGVYRLPAADRPSPGRRSCVGLPRI
jgi:hypothetical protein